MNPTVPHFDATLEAMLARRAARARPSGLHEAIMTTVGEVPQARRPLLARWLPVARGRAEPWFGPSLRPAWVVVVAGLLLALLAGLLAVGARLLERPQPTELLRYADGMEALTGGNDWWSARTDVDGNVWAYSPGHLALVDASSGEIGSWSVSDDQAFASAGIAPARDGGVWVIGKGVLRRFDGSAFRDGIEAPGLDAFGEIWGLAEAPDGALWAALGSFGVRRWDGGAWTAVGEDKGVLFATFVTVDAAGRVWAGGTYGGFASGGVAVYDGTRWTTHPGSADAPASRSSIRFIAVAPDGATWVGTDGGVARLDGATWTDLTPDIFAATGASPAGPGVVSIAFGADGAAWVSFLGNSETGIMPVHVARFDGRVWTGYGPANGLPGSSYAAWVATTSTDVYVTASEGLFQLTGARWERAWPTSLEPGLVRQLLAISADEAWAASDTGLFHYLDGAWRRDDPPGTPADGSNAMLAQAPDGRLWAGGYHGLAVRDADGWRIVGGIENARPLAFAPDGSLWVAESHYPADEIRLASVRPGDREVSPELIGPSPLGWISSLAVAADGTLWVGSDGFFAREEAGLARYDGQRWERVRPLGAVDVAVWNIEAAPNGDVWVAFSDGQLARFDGTTWVAFEADGLPTRLQSFNLEVAVSPDGTVWAPTPDGLARFDGERWTIRDPGMGFGRVSVAPDGTVWVTGPSGIQRISTADGPG